MMLGAPGGRYSSWVRSAFTISAVSAGSSSVSRHDSSGSSVVRSSSASRKWRPLACSLEQILTGLSLVGQLGWKKAVWERRRAS
jgi:hypothetical protein